MARVAPMPHLIPTSHLHSSAGKPVDTMHAATATDSNTRSRVYGGAWTLHQGAAAAHTILDVERNNRVEESGLRSAIEFTESAAKDSETDAAKHSKTNVFSRSVLNADAAREELPAAPNVLVQTVSQAANAEEQERAAFRLARQELETRQRRAKRIVGLAVVVLVLLVCVGIATAVAVMLDPASAPSRDANASINAPHIYSSIYFPLADLV